MSQLERVSQNTGSQSNLLPSIPSADKNTSADMSDGKLKSRDLLVFSDL